jgi:hypothetical protein
LFVKEKLTYVEPHLRIKPKVIEVINQDHPNMQVVASETQKHEIVSEEEIDTEDYTKAEDLKKLFSLLELSKGHTMVSESLICLNCNDFFKKYLADSCEFP